MTHDAIRALGEQVCRKCGSDEIGTTWHPKSRCSFDSCHNCHKTHRCKGGDKEHLVRRCRGCQFEWYVEPLDAQKVAAQ